MRLPQVIDEASEREISGERGEGGEEKEESEKERSVDILGQRLTSATC